MQKVNYESDYQDEEAENTLVQMLIHNGFDVHFTREHGMGAKIEAVRQGAGDAKRADKKCTE